LLPDKNSHIYSALFLKTIEICLQNNLRFQPVTVVMDFEIAIHIEIKNIWPKVQIHGCNVIVEYRKKCSVRVENRDW